MAARSRAIESRLERLAPALEEFYVAGIVTIDERNTIARTRLTHEYKLVARPLLAADVRKAIDFEQALEDKITAYTAGKKLQLKNRWAVLDRIESIFLVSVPRLRDAEQRALEDDFIAFLRRVSRNDALSRYLAEKVSKFPREPRYWCLAAEWESEVGNADHARATIQRAVELLPTHPSVWLCALHIEVEFAHRALDRVRHDSAYKGRKAEALREENAALGSVLIDLILAKTVAAAAIASPAASGELLTGLVDVALKAPFGKGLALHILRTALAAPECPAGAAASVFKVASRWMSVLEPAEFVEGTAELVEPSFEAGIVAMDALGCQCDPSRTQIARTLLSLIPVAPAPPVSNLISRRFVGRDWSGSLADTIAAISAPAYAADAVAACLPEALPTGDGTVDALVVEKMQKQGLCDASAAGHDLELLVASGNVDKARSDAAALSPRALEDWKIIAARIRLGRPGRKQRSRDEIDSESDSDAPAVNFGSAAAHDGFLFLVQHSRDCAVPWRRTAVEEAAAYFARWGSVALLAEASKTTLDEASRADLPRQSVSVQSAVVDGLAKLVASMEPLVLGTPSALKEVVLPQLVAIAEGTAAATLRQRSITLARRCFDHIATRDKSIAEAYAKFELEVAKRPDFASNVRRRLR